MTYYPRITREIASLRWWEGPGTGTCMHMGTAQVFGGAHMRGWCLHSKTKMARIKSASAHDVQIV